MGPYGDNNNNKMFLPELLHEIEHSEYNEFVIEYIKNNFLCIINVICKDHDTYYFNDFNANIYTDKINKCQLFFFLKVLENSSIVNVNLRKFTTSVSGFPLQKLKMFPN